MEAQRPPRGKLLSMYRLMQLARRFDESVIDLYASGQIPGFMHLYVGEEAVAVGACSALAEGDTITSTHRGHGHCIAKGGDPRLMMAELFARADGYCKGKGGSMHIANISLGILGANGIVGGGPPIAAGAALAAQMNGTGRVAVCFFGDGASNEGTFHEAANLAAAWKLPVVFVCENNLYAQTTPQREHQAIADVAQRAAAYGMPASVVDGMDVLAVYAAVSGAVAEARAGRGPTLVECRTYRYRGHWEGDPQPYRTPEEIAGWKKRDCISSFGRVLLGEYGVSEDELSDIRAAVERQMADAVAFARASPAPRPEAVLEDVYSLPEAGAVEAGAVEQAAVEQAAAEQAAAEQAAAELGAAELAAIEQAAIEPAAPVRPGLKGPSGRMSVRQAINGTLDRILTAEPRALIFGEDVGLLGGAFSVTKGLFARHGAMRVRNTPISESAIIGAAIGSAAMGMLPIAEIMFCDFLYVAMDQIVNQMAKMKYMYGGNARLPIVVRCTCGSGFSAAAQHSQSNEAMFMHVPGLKILMPSTPQDAAGLLLAAFADPNPVLFFEHKGLYDEQGEVTGEPVPIGKARIVREGSDITVVTYGKMRKLCEAAASTLAAEGIGVEVIDLRTLLPFDAEMVLASVRKTGRAAIVHEAPLTAGAGAELAAVIGEHAFGSLRGPVVRIAGLDVPMPFAPVLEAAATPSAARILDGLRRAVR